MADKLYLGLVLIFEEEGAFSVVVSLLQGSATPSNPADTEDSWQLVVC